MADLHRDQRARAGKGSLRSDRADGMAAAISGVAGRSRLRLKAMESLFMRHSPLKLYVYTVFKRMQVNARLKTFPRSGDRSWSNQKVKYN
jgi:hypothetical protein